MFWAWSILLDGGCRGYQRGGRRQSSPIPTYDCGEYRDRFESSGAIRRNLPLAHEVGTGRSGLLRPGVQIVHITCCGRRWINTAIRGAGGGAAKPGATGSGGGIHGGVRLAIVEVERQKLFHFVLRKNGGT